MDAWRLPTFNWRTRQEEPQKDIIIRGQQDTDVMQARVEEFAEGCSPGPDAAEGALAWCLAWSKCP